MNLSSNPFNLTQNEVRALRCLVQNCLDGMGGERPADLEHDEYTWADASDLHCYGYSKHEAAGYISALDAKNTISPTHDQKPNPQWVVNTNSWKWMDTVWEETAYLMDAK